MLRFGGTALLVACATGGPGQTSHSDAGANPSLIGDGSACVGNLKCRQVDCAARGAPSTTLSGIVYDPAGAAPVFNVFVYVPNARPDPIAAGAPRCAQCQADATGQPIVWASTDSAGWFHIANVPTGDDVPLVLQIGKWRRQIVVPHIEACVDNTLVDPHLVRLPGKSSEGDMPQMALATGCDAIECFLQSVGIDASEFTGPGGPGHVHVYNGRYQGLNIDGAGDAYNLWADPTRLAAYDLVLAACECATYPRDTEGPAYAAMETYLNGGGRFFTTHYHANWFSPPSGPVAWQQTAEWQGTDDQQNPFATFLVDDSFPKGRALADWLERVALSPSYTQVDLTDTRSNVRGVNTATRWIYSPNDVATGYQAKYLSFNTPVPAAVKDQCGRAVFSDVHVSGTSDGAGEFPAECGGRTDPHSVNQQALEFLFFDLVSCVQDESQAPATPPH